MREAIYLWKKEEYPYPYAGEFLPNLRAYLHEDGEERPAMLVIPGGGYAVVSPTEGEIVAKKFFEAGYQAFVLTYTTNMFQQVPLGKLPLRDASRGLRYIRKNAEQFHIRPNQIACCGFSAGGHLAASLAVHFDDPALAGEPDGEVSNRPDAVVLSYPVITSGELAHRGSFDQLLGRDASEEELDWASLEKHVTAHTPPAFLWQTFTDETVPVENSILFAKACREAGVPCELHLFMEGAHGLSLADEDWAEGRYGEDSIYNMEQHWQSLKCMYAQKPEAIPEILAAAARAETLKEFAEEWGKALSAGAPHTKPSADPSARQWPDLAKAWLDKIWEKAYVSL